MFLFLVLKTLIIYVHMYVGVGFETSSEMLVTETLRGSDAAVARLEHAPCGAREAREI